MIKTQISLPRIPKSPLVAKKSSAYIKASDIASIPPSRSPDISQPVPFDSMMMVKDQYKKKDDDIYLDLVGLFAC